MHLKGIRIRNFRRLKDVKIELEPSTSIFVGANNSGKTSATHIFYNFLERQKFALHDFSMECWKQFDDIGVGGVDSAQLPKIGLDLWFSVSDDDLHKVLDLLPSLDWDSTPVGVRLEYAPKDCTQLLKNYNEAYSAAKKGEKDGYHPWPKSLTDYLSKRQNAEYEVKYYVLDFNKFDGDLNPIGDYEPAELGDGKERSGSKILKGVIRVDFLNAQRHLSDLSSSGRSEDLSKRLSRFYERNLKQREEDFEALRTLSASETSLTAHLTNVFAPTLMNLNKLGYPGLSNPTMIIKAALNQEAIVSQNARLHYTLANNVTDVELPDSYNGLGFKNLIYMVIELLDFHAAWTCDENRPPLHLVLVEEPEAHLHTQLQQVFIREILKILNNEEKDPDSFKTQLIVTTHSPHIIYESGFKPIRYFNRNHGDEAPHTSVVLNLSEFKFDQDGFLERYMKLTHCDLFFADGAILVEGNVERLLLPLMIDKVEKQLQSSYLTILEVGGAYAFRFKELIEFLGLTTLVITDLDCVSAKGNEESDDDELDDDEIPGDEVPEVVNRKGKACLFDEADAETSNTTLAQWLPKMKLVSELIKASQEERTQLRIGDGAALVYVSYQSPFEVEWDGVKESRVGRTFEEAFALENLSWTQDIANKKVLGLRVINTKDKFGIAQIHKKLFTRIKSKSFKKTDFALSLLAQDPESWTVPEYIAKGLRWLNKHISPNIEEQEKLEAVVQAELAEPSLDMLENVEVAHPVLVEKLKAEDDGKKGK